MSLSALTYMHGGYPPEKWERVGFAQRKLRACFGQKNSAWRVRVSDYADGSYVYVSSQEFAAACIDYTFGEKPNANPR